MAEVWGYPCARERSDGPLPLLGAAPPLSPSPEEMVSGYWEVIPSVGEYIQMGDFISNRGQLD
jgi:hypothetical protein